LAYSRPNTLKKVLEACEGIVKVKVVMDYPENNLIAKQQEKILDIINLFDFCDLRRRNSNYGLVKSVITTVTEELEENEHVIMLEDDCVPHKEFFDFMSAALVTYTSSDEISTICGTRTRCRFNPWGWATWKHKWHYKHLSPKEILKIPELDAELQNFLENNEVEDSIWSLSWLAHQYANNCRALYPEINLINNIGLNDSGVHSATKGYTQWLLSQIIVK